MQNVFRCKPKGTLVQELASWECTSLRNDSLVQGRLCLFGLWADLIHAFNHCVHIRTPATCTMRMARFIMIVPASTTSVATNMFSRTMRTNHAGPKVIRCSLIISSIQYISPKYQCVVLSFELGSLFWFAIRSCILNSPDKTPALLFSKLLSHYEIRLHWFRPKHISDKTPISF